jgi:outer membrane protein assembly factor BamB
MQPGNWCNLIAFDKATGEIRYRTPLKFYSWSSPVAFYNEKSEMFIVTGDTYGNIYIISGKDGKVLHRSQIGNNFESSTIAVDSCIIVGSRGQEIYKLSIQ